MIWSSSIERGQRYAKQFGRNVPMAVCVDPSRSCSRSPQTACTYSVHVPNVAAVRLAAIHWPTTSWKGGTTEREARSTGTGTRTVSINLLVIPEEIPERLVAALGRRLSVQMAWLR